MLEAMLQVALPEEVAVAPIDALDDRIARAKARLGKLLQIR